MFKQVCVDNVAFYYHCDWFLINNFSLTFSLNYDPLACVMAVLITTITLLVMTYSYGYLHGEPKLVPFFLYLTLFCFSMLALTTAGNFIQLFIGWEGVGLASYLLISFWNSRNEANQGGLKAVIVNRIGDVFFLFALAIIWANFKSFETDVVSECYGEALAVLNLSNLEGHLNTLLVIALPFCLFIAACAKSAQIFFHTWLADAMEGPTPVSSLLHSATMVTAGVFLIVRSSHIFTLTPYLNEIMAVLGLITAVVPGLLGLVQADMKRVIAYSTCSQLGYMVYACSLGYYGFAMFHLVTHAFFKCLLFLCSGSVIHAVGDEQDIRKLSHLFNKMPLTAILSIIGSLALGGIPAMAGYYSKDLLLETSFSTSSMGVIMYIIGCFAAFLTISYSVKLLYITFFSEEYQGSRRQNPHIHEASWFMLVPMIILSILAIVSGYLLKDIFTGPFSVAFWNGSIAYPILSSLTEYEYTSTLLKYTPTLVVSSGIILSLLFFNHQKYYYILLKWIHFLDATKQKFYFDHIYNWLFSAGVLSFGYFQYKVFDRGLLEFSVRFLTIVNKSNQWLQKFTMDLRKILIIFIASVLAVYVSMEVTMDIFVESAFLIPIINNTPKKKWSCVHPSIFLIPMVSPDNTHFGFNVGIVLGVAAAGYLLSKFHWPTTDEKISAYLNSHKSIDLVDSRAKLNSLFRINNYICSNVPVNTNNRTKVEKFVSAFVEVGVGTAKNSRSVPSFESSALLSRFTITLTRCIKPSPAVNADVLLQPKAPKVPASATAKISSAIDPDPMPLINLPSPALSPMQLFILGMPKSEFCNNLLGLIHDRQALMINVFAMHPELRNPFLGFNKISSEFNKIEPLITPNVRVGTLMAVFDHFNNLDEKLQQALIWYRKSGLNINSLVSSENYVAVDNLIYSAGPSTFSLTINLLALLFRCFVIFHQTHYDRLAYYRIYFWLQKYTVYLKKNSTISPKI